MKTSILGWGYDVILHMLSDVIWIIDAELHGKVQDKQKKLKKTSGNLK